MSGSAYLPPSEQAPIFNSSLFPTSTNASSGAYLTYPTAQSGLETLSSIQVNGTATFVNDITANGYSLGKGLSTVNNLSLGLKAFNSTATGIYNVSILGDNLAALTTGAYNVAISNNCLASTTTGAQNIAIGPNVLASNISGSNNICMGNRSAQGLTSGSGNIGIGFQTLQAATANNVTCLGYGSSANSGLTQSTAIGANSQVLLSNTVQLGTAAENVNCPGTLSVAGSTNLGYIGAVTGVFTGSISTTFNGAAGVSAVNATSVNFPAASVTVNKLILPASITTTTVNTGTSWNTLGFTCTLQGASSAIVTGTGKTLDFGTLPIGIYACCGSVFITPDTSSAMTVTNSYLYFSSTTAAPTIPGPFSLSYVIVSATIVYTANRYSAFNDSFILVVSAATSVMFNYYMNFSCTTLVSPPVSMAQATITRIG